MLFATVISVTFNAGQARATIRYVDDNSGVTPPTGSDWSSPFKYLQDALDASNPGDEIRVAGGTYRADQDTGSNHVPNDQNETFSIKVGVKLFGGYAGLALPSTPDVRNITLYQTILAGSIGNPTDETDNTDQIVTILGTANQTLLDGLYIMYGHSDEDWDKGVGITVVDNGATPTIRNCVITDNTNTSNFSFGAGIWFEGDHQNNSDVTIENCQFSNNHAFSGGALACKLANPTVKDCVFARNSADQEGGAIWIDAYAEEESGSGTFKNCVIANNTVLPSVLSGSTYRRGGGVYCLGKPSWEVNSHPTFKNCEFLNNTACFGGGVYSNHVSLDVIGCNFRENRAISWILSDGGSAKGGGMYAEGSNPGGVGGKIFNTKFDSNATIYQSGHGSPATAGYGGGLFAVKKLPLIVNSAFYRNTSGIGAGMYGNGTVAGFQVEFLGINNTFSENTALSVGGGYAGHFAGGSNGAAFINSIFWNNYSANGGVSVQDAQVFSTDGGSPPPVLVTYSCVQDDDQNDSTIPFDPTNIDDDPRFRSPAVDNYRLMQCSPAIDIASTPVIPQDALNVDDDTLTICNGCTTDGGERAPDLDRRTRVLNEPSIPDGTQIESLCFNTCPWVADMGAWEFIPMPCEIMGDVSGNGVLNEKDFSYLTECIASGRFCPCGDMDGNGVLDSADLVCLFNLITYGSSPCDGVVMCDTFGFFAGPNFGGSGEGQETSAESSTWATLAATGVAESAAACLSQGSQTSEAEVDNCALALRWLAFEQWVAAHPVENFGGSVEAYDAWAQLQFRRIVIEGKMP